MAGHVVALDLGGTSLRGLLATGDGDELATEREATRPGDADAIIRQLCELIDRLRQADPASLAQPLLAVGVSVPSAPDPRTGRHDSITNVAGLKGVALVDELRERLGVPVVVDNDGNLAALAEGRRGAAQGVRDYVAIVIGTGMGMGIVLDGELRRGHRGMAGEIAWLPLGADPLDPEARRVGAYEMVAAGPAVRARITTAIAAGGTALATGATLADAVQAAAAGDHVARQLVDEEAAIIALGIAAISAVIDPELVVLSGGVGSIPGLLPPVQRAAAALMIRVPRIATGALGERGPLLGALEAALDVVGRGAATHAPR